MKSFVQIGANVGVTSGDSFIIEAVKNKYCGLFVEPHPEAFKVLYNNYHTISGFIFEQACVTDTTGEIDFYVPDLSSKITEHGSCSLEMVTDKLHHSLDTVTTIKMQSLTLEDLLKKHGLEDNNINYLLVDTEGYDYRILINCNLNNYDIDTIMFEHLHMSIRDLRKLNRHLLRCFYHLESINSENAVYTRNDLSNLNSHGPHYYELPGWIL